MYLKFRKISTCKFQPEFYQNVRKQIGKAYESTSAKCPDVNRLAVRIWSAYALWVSDITYIRTKDGWLYLATVIDLYSRKIIGHSTGHRQTTPLIIQALKMATSRLKKGDNVILHSDQGSQYSSYEYKTFAKKYNITLSMSRRGNCYDNAVAESFFKTLKKELVRKQVFVTRETAASKIFEYIEMFYNSKRRHSYLNYISPNEFEKRYNLEAL